MYFLVMLRALAEGQDVHIDHEPFIDLLIARNVILLGGRFATPLHSDVSVAYLLRCDSRRAAEDIVDSDPLVERGLAAPTITEWDLVAINTAAIEDRLAVTSDHPAVQSEP
jgi:hypothetical protein